MTLMLCFSIADAKCRRNVQMRYRNSNGWSKVYTKEVTLLSGKELNDATGTSDYNTYSHYCTVFWSPGEATIIELKKKIEACPSDISCNCIDNFVHLNWTGKDQDGDIWEICLLREGFIPNCF